MGITPYGFQWAIAVLKSLFPGTTGQKRHFPQENTMFASGGKDAQIVEPL
jgi:hypothetical protein